MSELLVVAGEASGDRAAAGVVAALAGHDVRAFGMGGAAMQAAGVELVSDLRSSTALGVGEVAARAFSIGAAYARVAHAARSRRPRAALLVNYTAFNTRLAHGLHAAGVRVLWYGAPQVWAWRPGRARSLRGAIDRMAVILPFEEAIWRGEGVDACYVGHPAREGARLDRSVARAALGLTPTAATVGILPGSRPHEVKKLLRPMLEAYESVRRDRASVDARVLLAPSLDAGTRARALADARAMRVEVTEVDPEVGLSKLLPAFDASLCASGTASLEAALARAVPVIAYRVGLLTELAARRLLRVPYLALPNVLLGRKAFTELLQKDARAPRLADALAQALDGRDALLLACAEVEAALGAPRTPSIAVAKMLEPWLFR